MLSGRRLVLLAALAAVLAGLPVAAEARGLSARLAPGRMIIDGVPKEWDADWRTLDERIDGAPSSADDASARVALAYDDRGLYLAAQVRDDKLVGGGDHLELLLGIPGGIMQTFRFFPGVAGKSRARLTRGRTPVRGAKIVEAPTDGGYTLEALIPWRAIAHSSTVRVGYRGAVRLHDADRSRRSKLVLGTTEARRYAELPPISTEPELALGSGLLREHNLVQPPSYNLMADLVGDSMRERLLVFGRYLIVLGPHYRDGEQYYFRDLGARADRGRVPQLELRDLTGDGKADILLRRRVRGPKGSVEVVEILSYQSGGEVPEAVFAQEVRLDLAGGRIVNELRLSGRGSHTRIVLRAGKARGIDRARFRRHSSTGANPVLVPWGTVAAQTYGVRDGHFVVIDEKQQVNNRPPPPASHARAVVHPRRSPSSSSGTTARPDQARVYALYKKQRGVRGPPRFDRRANLVGDRQLERLVVHGRDLVVFGPGYRDGRGFAAVTLAQLDKSADIHKVWTRDLTGDGRHEIIVEGEIRSPLPDDVGSGEMHRRVVMVYRLDDASFQRVFAAEVGRRIGSKRIIASIRFSSGASAIELRPGRAIGYSERSYPWRQKDVATDGFEPLLLPWGGIDRVTLHWDGRGFSR